MILLTIKTIHPGPYIYYLEKLTLPEKVWEIPLSVGNPITGCFELFAWLNSPGLYTGCDRLASRRWKGFGLSLLR